MKFRFYLTYKNETLEIKEPVGFDGFKTTLKRDKATHGVTFELSFDSLEFDGEGRKLIQRAYKENGTKAVVSFTVDYLCLKEFKQLYNGNLEFATYTEIRDEWCRVKINVGESNVNTLLASNMEKQFELKPATRIKLPPKSIYATSKSSVGESDEDEKTPYMYIGSGSTIYDEEHDLTTGGKTIFSLGGLAQTTNEFMELSVENVPTSQNGYFTTDEAGNDKYLYFNKLHPSFSLIPENISIKYSYPITLTLRVHGILYDIGEGATVKMAVRHGVDSTSEQVLFINNESSNTRSFDTGVREFKFNLSTVEAKNSQDIYIYFFVEEARKSYTEFIIQLYSGSFIEVSASTQYKETSANVYMLDNALTNLVKKCTTTDEYPDGQLLYVRSYYYDDENRAITTGMNIRNGQLKDGKEPVIFISLKELLNSLVAIDNIGMEIVKSYNVTEQGVVDILIARIEPARFFYKNEVVLTLGNITTFERSVDKERLYNILKTGYSKWEGEGSSGLDAIFSKREYSTNEPAKKTLTQECKLIADGYAIETTRRKQDDLSVKDWKYDSDTFIICLTSSNKVEQGKSGENMVDPPSAYNLRISPARMAMKWFGYMFSSSSNVMKEELVFDSADGNYVAKTQVTASKYDLGSMTPESEPITADMMPPEVYMPITRAELIDVECPLTVLEFEKLRENPLGIIVVDGEQCWLRSVDYQFSKGLAKFILMPKF